MANNDSSKNAPEVVGVSVEVSGHLIGRSVIDDLRRSLTASGQEQKGDEYMDHSREILQKHLRLIEPDTQRIIEEHIHKLVMSIRYKRLADCESKGHELSKMVSKIRATTASKSYFKLASIDVFLRRRSRSSR